MKRRLFFLALLAVACVRKEPEYPEYLPEKDKIVESPPPAYGNKIVKWPGKDSNQRHSTAFRN